MNAFINIVKKADAAISTFFRIIIEKVDAEMNKARERYAQETKKPSGSSPGVRTGSTRRRTVPPASSKSCQSAAVNNQSEDKAIREQNDWCRHPARENVLIGYYYFRHRKNGLYFWKGAIEFQQPNIMVHICHPPRELQRHKHWACFNHIGDGWYNIHFVYQLNGIDDAILNVQRLIAEAMIFSGETR